MPDQMLIMKGGGVKGLAFVGALEVLEECSMKFNIFVGTSAGAITASLLAAGCSPKRIQDILESTSFLNFLDAPIFIAPFRLLIHKGLFPGNFFRKWIYDHLHEALGESELNMSKFGKHGNRLIMFASDSDYGTLTFDSAGAYSGIRADMAVRYSMSIPVFFDSKEFQGADVYDGGVLNNFPIEAALSISPGCSWIGLYLGSRKWSPQKWRWLPFQMLRMWLGQDEIRHLDQYASEIISIDCDPISTLDFQLSDREKEFLISQGRACAYRHLYDHRLPNSPTLKKVQAFERIADLQKVLVKKERAARQFRNSIIIAIVILLISTGAFMLMFWTSIIEILNTRTTGLRQVYPASSEIHGDMNNLITSSKTEIYFFGLNFFTSVINNRETLCRRLDSGISVKYLILDPTSEYIPMIAADLDIDANKLRSENLDTLNGLVELSRAWKGRTPPVQRSGRLEIRFHNTSAHGRLYVFDPNLSSGTTVLVPYMNIANSPSLPAYRFSNRKGSIGEGYYKSILKLWEKSISIDEFVAVHPEYKERLNPLLQP